MKSTKEVLKSFELTVERYLAELTKLNMDKIHRKLNEEDWSIGQMYVHLIQSAFMHLHNVEQCLAGNESTLNPTKEKTEQGKIVFKLEQFPAVRIKVPASRNYTPQSPESMEHLVEGLHSVVERMRNTESVLLQVPVSNKILHPAFGALNAQEWFMLIEMHYRHHFLQLDRLKSLAFEE
ncbi:DinB family protein [Lysinibacillus capsici]|uniref:DinB family protein n=1 Tax=Lysinibacillus capsici TaxID=2115968 RepID=UPI0021538CA3|nr:DinB family protein [Lysinibacillus capsici]MCR6522135.1 DinB family protein [Lysinibacillus capsici]MED4551089.1 DinB family protein [Lysinibacillus capsici]